MKKKLTLLFVSFLMTMLNFQLTAQTTSTGDMPQYLFREFSKSDVLMNTGQMNNVMLNYNIVTEKMVFLNNDKYYDMTNTDAIDTVYLNGSKFIPVGKSFYEVLAGGPATLFMQHKGNLSPAGKPVGYGGTSQTSATTYISSIELSGMQTNLPLPKDYVINPADAFWIRTGDKWADFTSEKQFLAIFPDKAAELKTFIKVNKIKFDRPANLISLVKYLGTL